MTTARSQTQRRGFAGGCLTCRMRKVKCDEQRPSCQRCLSTGRTCDGYTALPFTRSDLQAAAKRARYANGPPNTALVSTLLSDETFGDTLERRYFQFFRCSTLASTALTVDSNFWDRTVVQAFHSEAAIRHAVLSIGAIHNYMIDIGDNNNNNSKIAQKHLLYAEKHYVMGLGEASKLIAGAPQSRMNRILIVCVLFILWEGMRGNYVASKSHMESGRALLKRFCFETKGQSNTQNHLSDILQVFARVDVSAITFSDASAPYSYSLPDVFAIDKNTQLEPFTSLQQASSVLMEIVRWMLMLANEVLVDFESGSSSLPSHLATAIVYCKHQIKAWETHWMEWVSKYSHESASLPALNAKLWHTTAKLMIEAGFAGAECRFDGHEEGFSQVVNLAEQLSNAILNEEKISTSFSLDLGYIVPAFYAATRCREPGIRRRAVDVLQLQARHEGAWQSIPAAVICKRWIKVEEDGLVIPFPASQVTEERRVSTMDVEILQQQRLAKLRFHLSRGPNGSAPIHMRKETVNWG